MLSSSLPLPPPEVGRRRALALLAAGVGVALAAEGLRTPTKTKPTGGEFDLEGLIPRNVPGWSVRPTRARASNPQAQELIERIYSQIVERLYVDASGYVLMVVAAYGADQRGNLEAHRPEVCYPAQGFAIRSNSASTIPSAFGELRARQVHAVAGERSEPLTYWFAVAGGQVETRLEKRIQVLKSTLSGQIPDGLLFRVSSIDKDTSRAWRKQVEFIQSMIQVADATGRRRLAGLAR